jgi:hypothetical protein
MRNLRKLLAFSAVGAACAFLSWPAHASTSAWDHNGSVVVLEESGKKRKLVYSEPRGTLDTAGVKSGTVLFDGEEKADGRLAGYAKLFRAGCDPVDYFVEGSLDKSKGEILLQGQAPIYSGNGCKITGYSDDNTASSLTFRQQGGSYVAREEQAQPDAGGAYSSRYAAPEDPEPSRDDPAYADPRGADPRYGDRGYADPRAADPRYADPRGDAIYGERNYADRRPPLPGNDGYSLRRPHPDDPDADADDFEEEEPAYVPYRPFWRWGN